MNYYYADANNQPVGPIAEDSLDELYRAGIITFDSFIIGEGDTEWIKYNVFTSQLVSTSHQLPSIPTIRDHPAMNYPKRKLLGIMVFVIIVLLTIGFVVYMGNKDSAQTTLEQPKSHPVIPKGLTQDIDIGIYTLKVPIEWKRWPDNEFAPIRKSVEAKMREIYQQYNNATMPVSDVAVAALRSPDKQINLILMSMQMPYKEGLFSQLREEAADKAKWGIQQGFIAHASTIMQINKPDFEGFYITVSQADNSLTGSAGMMHKNHQGQMLNIQLMASTASNYTDAQLEKELLNIVGGLKLK